MSAYGNVTWALPTWGGLSSSLPQPTDAVGWATIVVVLVCQVATLGVDLGRRCNRRPRRSMLGTLLCGAASSILLLGNAGHRNERAVVAAWAFDLFAASFWVVATLKQERKPLGAFVASALLGGMCTTVMGLFVPTRAIRHTLVFALTTVGAVLAWHRSNNVFVRVAATCYAASSWGNLVWEVDAPNLHHVQGTTGLSLYNMLTTQCFLLCVVLSYRVRERRLADASEEERETLV